LISTIRETPPEVKDGGADTEAEARRQASAPAANNELLSGHSTLKDILDGVRQNVSVYYQTGAEARARLEADTAAWAGVVDTIFDPDFTNDQVIRVMTTPLVLTLPGIDASTNPLVISPSTLRNSLRISRSKKQRSLRERKHSAPHAIPAETLKYLPEALTRPLYITKSQNNAADNSLIIGAALKDASGQTIITTIELNTKHSRNRGQDNTITTIYGRETPQNFSDLEWIKGEIDWRRLFY
jgi:hypothetical protein